MEKFKDFLYNKNDILVALLILAIAATIIFFRLDAIMEYPKILAEQQMQTVEGTPNEAEKTDKVDKTNDLKEADDSDKSDKNKSDDSHKTDDDKKSSSTDKQPSKDAKKAKDAKE